jgi:plastocyanin
MKLLKSCLGAAALLVICAAPAFAANFEVEAQPNLTFKPDHLTITAGDTVTFKNSGGTHNVVADNGSFKCAANCSDTGGTGNVSGAAWSFTRTFNTAGTFGYHCDAHGAPGQGMAGSITINAATTTGPNISGGFSGNWFNPTAGQGGHGFQIEILPNNGMLAIWFVFNPAGTAQNWIFAQGNYQANNGDVVLSAFLQQGGRFPPNFDSANVTTTPWGTLEIKFSDCTNGTVEYTPNDTALNAGYGHIPAFPIQRLTTIAGTSCQ